MPLTLEKALTTPGGLGSCPAEWWRYCATQSSGGRGDRYPAWMIALHAVVQCSVGTFTSSLRSVVTRRWAKTDQNT
ncbi:MAG: hypothetical protein ACTSP1_18235 [Candidatus Freyarchaeota archaeon]|nr:hypothetical protein [Candidatus Freyarchaeota archaeon]